MGWCFEPVWTFSFQIHFDIKVLSLYRRTVASLLLWKWKMVIFLFFIHHFHSFQKNSFPFLLGVTLIFFKIQSILTHCHHFPFTETQDVARWVNESSLKLALLFLQVLDHRLTSWHRLSQAHLVLCLCQPGISTKRLQSMIFRNWDLSTRWSSMQNFQNPGMSIRCREKMQLTLWTLSH